MSTEDKDFGKLSLPHLWARGQTDSKSFLLRGSFLAEVQTHVKMRVNVLTVRELILAGSSGAQNGSKR